MSFEVPRKVAEFVKEYDAVLAIAVYVIGTWLASAIVIKIMEKRGTYSDKVHNAYADVRDTFWLESIWLFSPVLLPVLAVVMTGLMVLWAFVMATLVVCWVCSLGLTPLPWQLDRGVVIREPVKK